MTHVRRLLLGSGFRRLVAGLAFALLCLRPARADAWFGFLDYLSGPGQWKGELYDLRVHCFGKELPEEGRLRRAVTVALDDSLSLGVTSPVDWAPLRLGAGRALGSWRDVFGAVVKGKRAISAPPFDKLDEDFPTDPPDPADDNFAQKIEAMARGDVELSAVVQVLTALNDLSRLPLASAEPLSTVDRDRILEALRRHKNSLAKAAEDGLKVAGEVRSANLVQSSVGVLFSLCPPDVARRWAIDVNVDYWRTNSNPKWSDTYNIRMLTVVPSVSLQLGRSTKSDWADLMVGVGGYRFISGGFRDFSGPIIQARVGVHGPTSWRSHPCLKVFSLITLVGGLTEFPGEIPNEKFNGTDRTGKVARGELIPTANVFFDLTPFIWGAGSPKLRK